MHALFIGAFLLVALVSLTSAFVDHVDSIYMRERMDQRRIKETQMRHWRRNLTMSKESSEEKLKRHHKKHHTKTTTIKMQPTTSSLPFSSTASVPLNSTAYPRSAF